MLKAVGLKKIYKMGKIEVRALDGVDLEVEAGDFVVIVGPSGSGKSTLMHILGALDRPTEGKVFVDGRDISKMDDYSLAMLRRKKIGFIFQQFNLIPTLSALDNVLIPTEPIKGDKLVYRKRANSLLKMLDLGDRVHHKPTELSGGQMQRVSIARSLINDPEIIFADEPTGNLDSVTGKKVVQQMLKLCKEENKTFVIVTHDTSLLGFASKGVHLLDGKIRKLEKNPGRLK